MATENNIFTDVDWSKLQQQYMDAVSSFYSASDRKSTNPWQDAMELWWKSVGGQLPENNNQVFQSILDQSKVFYSISEQFASMLGDIAKQPQGSDDWQGVMNSHLGNLKSMFNKFQNGSPLTSMAPGMMWVSPMEMWNQAMSSVMPEDTMNKLLQVPGVGLTKDLQEKTQKTLRLWNDYQINSQRYNATFAMLGKEALDKLGQEILARAESDKKITSLKEIYNMWIDTNEEVFAEYAQTEEYSKLYAGLVNSLVKFKAHYNGLTDDMLKTFNIPTSEGLGSITKQQQAVKRQLRDSREAQLKLVSEMERLKSELAKLKGNDTSAQKKKTAKKVVAKKSSVKPTAGKTSSKKKAAKKSK
jgi:class III poly(R)-hydroxyalkanoic acid synthase PhaE subunit